MDSTVLDPPAAPLPSIFDHFPPAATEAAPVTRRRRFAFRSGLVAIPIATGIGWLARSWRTGVTAGGLAALALGALRWQMARWFTETPAYEVEGRAGELELRRYPLLVEARASLEVQSFEGALDRGFGRLACYIFGANVRDEDLAMTTPVVTTLRDGHYTMAFIMPAGRSIASLPPPDDARIELREVPARRIAALRFHGRFTRDNIASHERRLLRGIVDAGLAARGSVAFVGYDSPATLPALRRNELWIEIV